MMIFNEDSYHRVGFVTTWLLTCLFVYKFFRIVYNNLLGPSFFSHHFQPRADSWAIVTGSTDGIGLEYARKLASKGYNILLISRSPDKLAKVQAKIKEDFPKAGEIKTLAFDFSSRDYQKVEEAINELPSIDVLINNVGCSYPGWTKFTEMKPWEEIDKMILVNMYSCTKMSHLVLPRMEAKDSGVIVNVSSGSSGHPHPLMAVYSASKVYMDYLSKALQIETNSKGVIIQNLTPHFVSTNMFKAKPDLFIPSASKFVNSAIKTIGVESNTTGYFPHKLLSLYVHFMPRDWAALFVYSFLQLVRTQGFKGMRQMLRRIYIVAGIVALLIALYGVYL